METVLNFFLGLCGFFALCGFGAWGIAVYYQRKSDYRKMDKAGAWVEPFFFAGIGAVVIAGLIGIFFLSN